MRRKKNLPTAQETSNDVSWAFFHSPHLPFVVSPSSPHCSVSQSPPVALFIVIPFGLVVALALSCCFAVVPVPTLRAVARGSCGGAASSPCHLQSTLRAVAGAVSFLIVRVHVVHLQLHAAVVLGACHHQRY